MAITKQKKQELFDQYVTDIKNSTNVVVISQSNIGVGIFNDLRSAIKESGGAMRIVKKTLFCRAVNHIGYDEVDKESMPGSIFIVFGGESPYAPLKVIANYKKMFDKKKDLSATLSYVGMWEDGMRKNVEYVSELANMPGREELLSKLARLLNYPIQGLAVALNNIEKE